MPGVPPVSQLADLGVARVSVGGAFAMAAWSAVLAAADELTERGTYGYFDAVAAAGGRVRAAFAAE
jgi:2-methylisocitrate lyase-like PEP mutase family enzyme